ncbi:MAG: hypothetical protein KF678_11330 [Phycisphaeraceae bacterium]|nr:hypothetical protein [Phycisphaeraceae bacterium]
MKRQWGYLAALLGLGPIPSVVWGQCNGRWIESPATGIPGVGGTVYAIASWDPDGGGPREPVIVAGGFFRHAGSVRANSVAIWDGERWRTMGNGLGVPGFNVSALAVFEGDVIVGGDFTEAGGAPGNFIARWNGLEWSPLGAGVNARVRAITVHDGKLYAGGDFSIAGTTEASRIACWDGSNWSPLSVGVDGPVHSLTTHEGQLIAGGSFLHAGGTSAARIAAWNGSGWTTLGAGISNGEVRSVASFLGMLYAGGSFTLPHNRIARWNGSEWLNLPPGFATTTSSSVDALHVRFSELVVGGWFSAAGGVPATNIATWDGETWHNAFPEATFSRVYSVASHGSTVVAGHTTMGISAWENGWRSLGSNFNDHIFEFTVFEGDLIATGRFTRYGATTLNRVARWRGAQWEPMGGGFASPAIRGLALAEYKGSLMIGGEGILPHRWDGSQWIALEGTVANPVRALVAFEEELFAISANQSPGFPGNSTVGRWNGLTWTPVPTVPDISPLDLVVHDGSLYALGHNLFGWGVQRWSGSGWEALNRPGFPTLPVAGFSWNGLLLTGSNGGAVHQWNGTSWSLMSGTTGLSDGPFEFAQLGDTLFGGGLNGIMRREGNSWVGHDVPQGVAHVSALAVLHGELVIGGETFVHSQPRSRWGRWSSNGVPWIARQPTNVSVEEGGEVQLTALPAPGYDFDGPLSFSWRRNGVPIQNGPGGASAGGGLVSGATGSIIESQEAFLSILSVSAADAGTYEVVISNACGSATSVGAVVVIAPPVCYANCDGSTGLPKLTANDFICFINKFAENDPYANCDGSTGSPVLTANDFQCFINAFANGCP